MKICGNCVLPETFPGIRFNEAGVCNYCLEFKGEENLEEKKQRYRKRFEELLQEHKGKASYDALMSYSGGKDSTYTLALLKKEYGLNLLALTMDNGFLPERTFQNIRNVVESLDIDHIFFKPRFALLKKIVVECSLINIYPAPTLIRASTICTACMAIVKFMTLRIAIEKQIPSVIFGWSPGQIPIASSIMKNNPEMLKVTQKAVLDPLKRLVGNEIRPYFLEERHFKEFDYFPYNISPLAFLDYDEECILNEVSTLGWEAPKDVDANSTNCLLNSFANIVHKEKHGFHPYAFEMAKLVREGYLDRSVALQKINQPEDQRTVKRVKKKLGLCP
jgi:predicted PP-loop superfamily ATPase